MVDLESKIQALMSRMDDALQSRARLGIISALSGAGSLDFKSLKRLLDLTDGNLASHLAYLERRDFVHIEKSFLGKRPHTEVHLTIEGRLALEQYVDSLAAIVRRTEG